MRKIDRRSVYAYIVSSDKKLLLGRKNPAKGGVYADCWHKPGGGVEEGESGLQWFALDSLDRMKLTPPSYKLFERIGTDWLNKS